MVRCLRTLAAEAAVNLKYGKGAEKVPPADEKAGGAKTCLVGSAIVMLKAWRRPNPERKWCISSRWKCLAQFSAQDLSGGCPGQRVDKMDLTRLLVRRETLGYKSAEVFF